MRTVVTVALDVPAGGSEQYAAGWERGDSFARTGGDLTAEGPLHASDEVWVGFVDALAAHRTATEGKTLAGSDLFELKPGTQIRNRSGRCLTIDIVGQTLVFCHESGYRSRKTRVRRSEIHPAGSRSRTGFIVILLPDTESSRS